MPAPSLTIKLTVNDVPKGGVVHLRQYDTDPDGITTDVQAPYEFQLPVPAAGTKAEYGVEVRANKLTHLQQRFTVNADAAVLLSTDSEQNPTTPPVTEQPARKPIRLTVVEGADAYALASQAGFDGVREWCSIDWTSGKIRYPDKIATCNKRAAAGDAVILTVTPAEHKDRKGERCKDFSVVADELVRLGLDKRVIVQLVNEGQHRKKDDAGNWYGPYWPDGDIVEATRAFAVPIGVKLKAAGFKLACPSITYGSPAKIVEWLDAIWAASPAGLWDYIDGHLYLGSIRDYENVAKCYADWAAAHGVTAISTEWSYKVGNENFPEYAAKLFAIMGRYFAIHCWFSFVYNAKFNPLNPYAFRDGKTTGTFDAIRKVLVPAVA